METKSNAILHLSDLHFGSLHAFEPQWGDGKSMVDCIVTRVEQLGHEIGVVVVSGDVTSRSEPAGFSRAKEQLLELLERLSLERHHCVLVPGNHDIELDKVDEQASRRYEHESKYRRFVDDFYGSRGESEEIESLTIYRTADNPPWTLRFVGLNSVRLRDLTTREYGYVGHRSQPWLQRLKDDTTSDSAQEAYDARELNVVVLHHHVLPATPIAPEATPVSLTVDAAKIVESCRDHTVHVILHGHQHYPFVASTARAAVESDGQLRLPTPLWVLGAGSAGVQSSQLTNSLRENTFGVYVPTEEGLEVKIEQFNPGLAPSTWAQGVIPLGGP